MWRGGKAGDRRTKSVLLPNDENGCFFAGQTERTNLGDPHSRTCSKLDSKRLAPFAETQNDYKQKARLLGYFRSQGFCEPNLELGEESKINKPSTRRFRTASVVCFLFGHTHTCVRRVSRELHQIRTPHIDWIYALGRLYNDDACACEPNTKCDRSLADVLPTPNDVHSSLLCIKLMQKWKMNTLNCSLTPDFCRAVRRVLKEFGNRNSAIIICETLCCSSFLSL